MQRRRALVMVAVSLALAGATWLQPQRRPEGWLLNVAGRPVDALGHLSARWQALVRRCDQVTPWPADSAPWREAQAALAAYSPPASAGAQPVQVLGWPGGDWLLAEVQWQVHRQVQWQLPGQAAAPGAPLDPAIVPLRRVAGRWQVQAEGVWSGDTGPWLAPVFIRRYLAERVPGLPAALRQCLDPRWPAFRG